MKFYLVGGAVRDKLLGFSIKDRDWVVVGSNYNEMIKLGFKPVGNDFPVFLHPYTREEYSLARTEKKSGKGYKGFICDFSKKTSLKEDLFRRDLTINSIAMDCYGNYYDPFGGINDIKSKIIRHISVFFLDDPLRVLRVARFYSYLYKLGFVIFNKTLDLMNKISNSNELIYLTSERIWIETEKVLKNYNVFWYFYILYKCGALKLIFPEFKKIFYFKKIKKFFFLVFNKTYKYKYGSEVNFVFLCFFLKNTIFLEDFFLSKNKIFNKVLFFCNRLRIKKNFLIIFKLIYNFLYEIHYFNNSMDLCNFFLDILCLLDVWRKPYIIDILLKVINIFMFLPFNNKKILYMFKKYILNIFYITKNIKNKYIIKLGYSGINIKNKLYNIRLKRINYYLLSK